MLPQRRARQSLLISVGSGYRTAAWLQDNRLVEFHREREDGPSPGGNVYLGRVTHVDKGLGAAFVDIGLAEAAFLPLREAKKPPVEGGKVVVQIEREGGASKGPRVTAHISLVGIYLILRPGRRGISVSERIVDPAEQSRLSALVKTIAKADEGFIVRTAASSAEEHQLQEEAATLRASWQQLLERGQSPVPAVLYRQPSVDLRLLRDHGSEFDEIVYDQRSAAAAAASWFAPISPALAARVAHRRNAEWLLTPDELLEQVESALQSRIAVPAGAELVIEPTEAMTVIDVNSSSASNARVDAGNERMLLKTNLEAAEEIARQVRLRNIGGIVVVDFIDLKDPVHRRQVVDRLRAAFADDSAPVWVGTMSRLGLIELTRKRRGPTLVETMTRPCAACEGTGRVRQSEGKA